jgi:site-specific recombinase XerD
MNEDLKMLLEAIGGYAKWVKAMKEQKDRPNESSHSQMLTDFLTFAINGDMVWEKMFTLDTLEAFAKYSRFKNANRALVSLSAYLSSHGKIDYPLEIPRRRRIQNKIPLPDLYEEFLHKQSLRVSQRYIRGIRQMLCHFHAYLEKNHIGLSSLSIQRVDVFMATFKVARGTRNNYRHRLKSFLHYLYREKKLLKKDLGSLLVGAPAFNQKKPPKFLRPQEVKQLFSSLTLSTPRDIRICAIVHLAYTLGLRPIEISRLTLDDIYFRKAELTIRARKAGNPVTLPLPEQTLKVVAAYVLKVRGETHHRDLFLTRQRPYRPLNPAGVIADIRKAMNNAELSSTAYWLRHTYAQNLLILGRTIYEIKEMMGHENIQTTHRYLHIDTERMRKVLFDETL